MIQTKKYIQLDYKERTQIEVMYNQGLKDPPRQSVANSSAMQVVHAMWPSGLPCFKDKGIQCTNRNAQDA